MVDDVASGLAQAFGRELPAETEQEPVITPDEPDVIEPDAEPEPIAEPVTEENEPTAEPDSIAATSQPAFDPNTYLKETFGLDADNLKTALQKANEPVELKFANEESKRIHEALVNGKEDEVTDYLATKRLLKDADKLTPEGKLKLQMKLQYPDFDSDDIEQQFQKEFGFDEDEIDETLIKSEKKKHAANLKTAAAKADEFFKGYQSKIELPNISPNQAASDAPTKEQVEAAGKWVNDFNQSLSSLKPEQAAIKTHFSDEANKMSFDVAFTPDAKGFESAKESAKNLSGWLDKTFTGEGGKPLTAELAAFIYEYENREKVRQELINQTKNSVIRWQLANGKQINIANGTQRNYTQQPVSEVEKVRKSVFG